MTREEAIHVIQSNRPTSGYTMLCEALDMAVAALREQEERENVWHDAKDSPPQKPGVYYGKVDDTNSMFACRYRDGVWTMNAYPGTRMPITEWAYYDAFVQDGEERRWIPVEERLPESEGTYLVYTERGSVYASHFYAKKVFRDDYVREPQWSQRGKVKVTHWMPLPEPPVEDEK